MINYTPELVASDWSTLPQLTGLRCSSLSESYTVGAVFRQALVEKVNTAKIKFSSVGDIVFKMDLNNEGLSLANIDKNITSASVIRPTISSGTFSIESILKSEGLRGVAPSVHPSISNFALKHPHPGFADVKQEALVVDDMRDPSEGMSSMSVLAPSSMPSSSLTGDSANCHDDSG